MGFAFVWEMNWLAVVSVIGIIAVFIARGYNEHSEYTLTAAEVQKIEEKRAELHKQRLKLHEAAKHEEEMGLIDFIRYILKFGLNYIRKRRA